MIYDLETILNAIACRARQAKGFAKIGSEAENRIVVEELKKDIDELLKEVTLSRRSKPTMKTYTITITDTFSGETRFIECHAVNVENAILIGQANCEIGELVVGVEEF